MDTFLRMKRRLKVLDVGSQDVNGSYKGIFPEESFEYTGLDMAMGKNVDICPENPYIWDEIPDESYDVVISGQVFEHSEFMWITMAEMTRVLKRRGLMCVIAPRNHFLHRYPVDCYRFDTDGMVALARYAGITPLHASTNLAPKGASKLWYSSHWDCMLVARKPTDYKGLVDLRSYRFEVPDVRTLAMGMITEKEQNYA